MEGLPNKKMIHSTQESNGFQGQGNVETLEMAPTQIFVYHSVQTQPSMSRSKLSATCQCPEHALITAL